MTTSTERIVDISGGTEYLLVAQPINFSFNNNPELNTADVRVEFIQMLEVDGTTRNVNYGSKGSVTRAYSEISTQYPAYPGKLDPESGADLTQISVKGIMILLQDMFDKMYVQDNPGP